METTETILTNLILTIVVAMTLLNVRSREEKTKDNTILIIVLSFFLILFIMGKGIERVRKTRNQIRKSMAEIKVTGVRTEYPEELRNLTYREALNHLNLLQERGLLSVFERADRVDEDELYLIYDTPHHDYDRFVIDNAGEEDLFNIRKESVRTRYPDEYRNLTYSEMREKMDDLYREEKFPDMKIERISRDIVTHRYDRNNYITYEAIYDPQEVFYDDKD